MLRRFIPFISVLVILIATLATTTSAQTSGNFTSSTANIPCYVWAGTNFNLSPNNCNSQASTANTSMSNTGGTQAPSSAPSSGGKYAALGDSVAAGLGLPSSDTSTACGRSSQAYPYQVAQSMHMQLVDVACSGATMGDLVSKQNVSGTSLPAQLDVVYASGTPQLITITAGANDAKWSEFVNLCNTSTCANDINSLAANGYMTVLRAKMEYVLRDIQRRSNGTAPTVVVTGYYNPISNYCMNRQTNIDSSEIQWLNQERDNLNQTIRDEVARFPFARYASTNFSGHGLCSADPWVQGLNDTAPLHPNAAGQTAIANSVLSALQQQPN